MAVANQRTVIIRSPSKLEKQFIGVYKDDLQAASKDLTGKELIVYLDLCGNKDGYKVEYSPAYFHEYYGISKDTARSAFDKLLSLGYITNEKNTYYFNRTRKAI